MRLFKLLLVLFLLEAWIYCKPLFAFERYEYIETTGSSQSLLTWEIDSTYETVIRVRQDGRAFITYCKRSGATYRWTYKSPNADVHAKRQGNDLHMTGTYDGKSSHASFSLGRFPLVSAIKLLLAGICGIRSVIYKVLDHSVR